MELCDWKIHLNEIRDLGILGMEHSFKELNLFE